jgi:hypothetical protein
MWYYKTTSRFVVCVVTFPQERQWLWLSEDDRRESSSWSLSPLLVLRDIHCKLFVEYDWKEVCAPSQSQVNTGTSTRLYSQDDVSQSQGVDPLSLPQLNLLFESSFVQDEISTSNTEVTVIPSQQCDNIRLPNRSSATVIPPLTSNLCLRDRVALNS